MKKTSKNTSRDKIRQRRNLDRSRMLWETACVVSDIGRRIPGSDVPGRRKLRHDLLRAVGRMHAELKKPRRR